MIPDKRKLGPVHTPTPDRGAGGVRVYEIALALLADVGATEPDEETKQRALEAYDVMIAKLEAIRDEALGLTPYQHRPHTPVSKQEH